MRRFHRVALAALLIGATPAITGCADFDLDKLDIFGLNQKKKLPGERHAVFPEGVPGVSQGIPPELMMGHEQAQTGAAIPLDGIKPAEGENKTAAAQPAEEKPKPKPKPKKVVQASRPTRINMAPQQQPAAASAPVAAPEQSAAPAAQPAAAQQAWPAPAQSGTPWPDPPPAGTFSKQ